mmetsp:Transcript_23166/g.72264  ORF Transcript_23166/g.72264 Transcript_23166/m.72264 type:complete len:204 (+) Transcript_23166:1441-2052(+)
MPHLADGTPLYIHVRPTPSNPKTATMPPMNTHHQTLRRQQATLKISVCRFLYHTTYQNWVGRLVSPRPQAAAVPSALQKHIGEGPYDAYEHDHGSRAVGEDGNSCVHAAPCRTDLRQAMCRVAAARARIGRPSGEERSRGCKAPLPHKTRGFDVEAWSEAAKGPLARKHEARLAAAQRVPAISCSTRPRVGGGCSRSLSFGRS